MINYLTKIEIVAMHYHLINSFGGTHGLRDEGALDSALYRPQSGYYDDIIQQAAALWESLSQNHPFLDGNKRVAFASVDVFLRMNEVEIIAEQKDIYAFIISSLENGKFEFKYLDEWLRDNTKSKKA